MPNDIPHQSLLQQRLPAWARQATAEQWRPLNNALAPAQGTTEQPPSWFANAAPDLREQVQDSQSRLARSQQALARAIKPLRQIAEFAEPLLAERLHTEHGFDHPLRSTDLIRIHHRWTHQVNVSRHERSTLLEAALHNFAGNVTFSRDSALAPSEGIQVNKSTVVGQTTLGDSETWVDIVMASETYTITALGLSPEDFARTCRELDLGQRYQDHLASVFAPSKVAELSKQVHRDRLRLAADIAFLRHRLTGAALDTLKTLLDGASSLPCARLSLFDIPLHEVLIIDAGQAGLLISLPEQDQALRQFTDMESLHEQLCSDLLDAAFRQRFLDYVPRLQQATFLGRLQQNLDANGNSPTEQNWQRRAQADLHMAQLPVTGEIFNFLHKDHVARLQAEARLFAVPTADADEQERKQRLALWESAGLDALMIAGLFVPAVGTFMLAVTAFQLLDEAYEGYEAWHAGDRHLALRHLEAVGLNLGLMAGLHVAGKVLPRLFNSPLLEGLDPITLDDGSQRLRKPDLAPYQSPVELPETVRPNAKGQYLHQGQHFIRIGGRTYRQALDSSTGRWRIVHPERDDAYRPWLEHNDEGAWHVEQEEPQRWSDVQLLRRLGPGFGVEALDDAELLEALDISGVDRARLQEVYLANQPTPALLTDTLVRMAMTRRLPELGSEALESLYASQATDELEQQLIQAYPRLTTPLARRLLARLSAQELGAWAKGEQLPQWLRSQAAETQGQLPILRAMEGLYRPALASSDSERLLLDCLERLPGNTGELRIELRQSRPDGNLLASTGPEQARWRRVLVKSTEGFEVYKGDRPVAGHQYRTLLDALHDTLPKAMRGSLQVDRPETLGGLIRQQAVQTRSEWPHRLWGLKRPSPRLGLRGGTPLTPQSVLQSPRNALFARYRRLYPGVSDTQISQVFAKWRQRLIAPEAELLVRERSLRDLRERLGAWAGEIPRRQRAARAILNAWRRNNFAWLIDGRALHSLDLSGLELENRDIADLTLGEGFRHIEDLNLRGNATLSHLPEPLLRSLPRLTRLNLGNCRFTHPPHIATAERLNWLDMEFNRITWDDRAQAALDRLSSLRLLDLSGNPLLRAPALDRLPGLRSLMLNNAHLSELPTGLGQLRQALLLDLSGNAFERLPTGFEVPPDVGNPLALESDWLNPVIREQIEDYYQRHGIDLLVSDFDYQELLHDASPERLRLWQKLPLHYRRGLRAVLESMQFEHDPASTREAIWQRIARMDNDPAFLQHALDRPALELLDL
ncbi:leucine-rich repeat domain-containing protein [Pseudomonas entomophila]|uniref:dermonecrotic toxin domain-containing protein n=1 Tax=Pseudomonas entomophila TaxID=312306 RepID=UPI001BCBB6D3|nr:DUF6543 domain-containing protein [Pseudomonas entomophila]QVM89167.1 leucine-rich repeat domain-containing protein [Pseudomonas entomophila]